MAKRFASFKANHLKANKKLKVSNSDQVDFVPTNISTSTDFEVVIPYLYNNYRLFGKAFNFPKVAFKSQFYPIFGDKSQVEQQIQKALSKGTIKMFQTSLGAGQFCVMLTKDYLTDIRDLHKKRNGDKEMSRALRIYMEKVVPNCTGISVSKELMREHLISDEEVTELIRFGVLTVKDFNQWWIAVPRVGGLIMSLTDGRKAVINIVKKSKHQESNCGELLKRKCPKNAKLGMTYLLLDLIGSNMLTCVDSTTGKIVRVSKQNL